MKILEAEDKSQRKEYMASRYKNKLNIEELRSETKSTFSINEEKFSMNK